MSPATLPPLAGPGTERRPRRRPLLRGARAWLWLAIAIVLVASGSMVLLVRQATAHRAVQADLDRAAVAFRLAREAGARTLAPDKWLLATTRMDEAMAELHRQGRRFVLIRDYLRVDKLLADAIAAAEVANAAAVDGTAVQGPGHRSGEGVTLSVDPGDKAASKAAIDAAKQVLDRAWTCLASIEGCPRAMRSREVRKALDTIKRNLEAMKQQVHELDATYSREQFAEAKAGADTLASVLGPIDKDLDSIRTKFKCN